MSGIVEIDTTRVEWPATPAVREAMGAEIHRLAREEGYTRFLTRKQRCLNGIESPDPDTPGPEGWDRIGFWSDCVPEDLDRESAVFPDFTVYAKKA